MEENLGFIDGNAVVHSVIQVLVLIPTNTLLMELI